MSLTSLQHLIVCVHQFADEIRATIGMDVLHDSYPGEQSQ